ncbi:MAG TPA: TylF/MycF/NovP-related O-methyltransferase [Phenylobacterium sp.]|uniref:TylF/MycF/NovP-related O-methyltransferase n=1 Tax=Phenylobacterium sp. TaxID=1871053 RepID=UPI002B54642E|nr:TylF/MycF/NovP-related O-methyltransferase [Phenylobacterium sp.]HXA39813.1 TylF/MycF/NovP-related O-methyltransferase [Phenylobacterium sp.]
MTIKDTSAMHLMHMGDGLMRAGDIPTAANLYLVALRRATPRQRQTILVRLGLATANHRRRVQLHDILQSLEAIGQNVFIGEGLATWQKTLPFLDDDRFNALAGKHAHLLPLANWHWNLQTVLWAVKQGRAVEGDFVELGVFKGHTTIFVAEYLEFAGWDKRWFLYDTFEGIPDDQLDPGWAASNKATYGAGTFSFEEVQERFAAFPNIQVIKGRVPEVLGEVSPERIAFLHVDLNNSTAEIAALDALYDRISPGGVIVFDDYCWLSAKAQHDAENRWFADRGLQQILALPTGQGLFIKTA